MTALIYAVATSAEASSWLPDAIANLRPASGWHWEGLAIGLATFLLIGIFHPIVIKTEYYFGTRPWWVFLIVGIIALVVGVLFVANVVANAILGAFAFSCFWSIGELFSQKKRVEKGWFPKNPKRK